ncbi:MAG: PHB depolymerase family esterase [Saprospiraceae bacterium]|nr:PHB depolymerase family esterase [Saprospiraceae bacterium]
MKNYFLFLPLVLCCTLGCHSGKTITHSIQQGGIKREFIVYIPQKYTANSPVPMVLNLHGYTSNAQEQMYYADFRTIADSANFILVHPEGTKYRDTTHWNTGGWTPGSPVDDLGFVDSLIIYMVFHYKIDLNRIYAAGFSNGGEMSYHLACHLSNKIAAIASVSGSMTPEVFRDCRPARHIPVLHIHGTQDQVVPFNGDPTATPIMTGLHFWVKNNQVDSIPVIQKLPDIHADDSSTVEYYVYPGPSTVEFFKINGGDHTWPGSTFKVPGTNYDIQASAEIWAFFNKYDLGGLRK